LTLEIRLLRGCQYKASWVSYWLGDTRPICTGTQFVFQKVEGGNQYCINTKFILVTLPSYGYHLLPFDR